MSDKVTITTKHGTFEIGQDVEYKFNNLSPFESAILSGYDFLRSLYCVKTTLNSTLFHASEIRHPRKRIPTEVPLDIYEVDKLINVDRVEWKYNDFMTTKYGIGGMVGLNEDETVMLQGYKTKECRYRPQRTTDWLPFTKMVGVEV